MITLSKGLRQRDIVFGRETPHPWKDGAFMVMAWLCFHGYILKEKSWKVDDVQEI